jgi:hypothetical protein
MIGVSRLIISDAEAAEQLGAPLEHVSPRIEKQTAVLDRLEAAAENTARASFLLEQALGWQKMNEAHRQRLVANGSRILEGIDGRTAVARRYAEVAAGIAVDLGGEDNLTELQKHLIRSVSGMVVLRERLDAKAVNGEAVNSATYCRLSNATRKDRGLAWLETCRQGHHPRPTNLHRIQTWQASQRRSRGC